MCRFGKCVALSVLPQAQKIKAKYNSTTAPPVEALALQLAAMPPAEEKALEALKKQYKEQLKYAGEYEPHGIVKKQFEQEEQ